jgi:hypothetical protein
MTLHVSFSLMLKFNFILTCYFDIFKDKLRYYGKTKKNL